MGGDSVLVPKIKALAERDQMPHKPNSPNSKGSLPSPLYAKEHEGHVLMKQTVILVNTFTFLATPVENYRDVIQHK